MPAPKKKQTTALRYLVILSDDKVIGLCNSLEEAKDEAAASSQEDACTIYEVSGFYEPVVPRQVTWTKEGFR